MPTFTLKEFIEENKLGVNVQDSVAVKLVTAKLRAAGYQHIRLLHKGVRQMVWTNERITEIKTLEEKLAKIKL